MRLGCKVLLEKICTPDVWLTTVELRSNMEGLDISVTELDNITEDVLDNDGTSELVLTNDISVLFIVDETRLVNKDDVGIGEIAFDSVEFPGWGVDGKITMLLVTKELVLADDVKFSTKVVFGGSKIKLDEEAKKVLFDAMDERFELVVDITVDKLAWLAALVISSDVLATGIKLLGTTVTDTVAWVININEDTFGIEEFNFAVDIAGKVDWSVVRTDGKLDEILTDVTRVLLLKDAVSEDAVTAMEMFPWDAEGTIVEEITAWLVFRVITVSELKIDLFCDDTMVDLLGEEALSIKDSVLVTNVEFRDGVWLSDIVIVLLAETMFVGPDAEELFSVSRSFEEVKILVMLVFILTALEDLNTVALSNWLDVVKLTLTLGDRIIVLFGKILEVVKLMLTL